MSILRFDQQIKHLCSAQISPKMGDSYKEPQVIININPFGQKAIVFLAFCTKWYKD